MPFLDRNQPISRRELNAMAERSRTGGSISVAGINLDVSGGNPLLTAAPVRKRYCTARIIDLAYESDGTTPLLDYFGRYQYQWIETQRIITNGSPGWQDVPPAQNPRGSIDNGGGQYLNLAHEADGNLVLFGADVIMRAGITDNSAGGSFEHVFLAPHPVPEAFNFGAMIDSSGNPTDTLTSLQDVGIQIGRVAIPGVLSVVQGRPYEGGGLSALRLNNTTDPTLQTVDAGLWLIEMEMAWTYGGIAWPSGAAGWYAPISGGALTGSYLIISWFLDYNIGAGWLNLVLGTVIIGGFDQELASLVQPQDGFIYTVRSALFNAPAGAQIRIHCTAEQKSNVTPPISSGDINGQMVACDFRMTRLGPQILANQNIVYPTT